MKPRSSVWNLIWSTLCVCGTSHIVGLVMGSSGLVKLKQPPPPTSHIHTHPYTHTHTHILIPLPLSGLPCAPWAIKPQGLFSITLPAPDQPLTICGVITLFNAGHRNTPSLTHTHTHTHTLTHARTRLTFVQIYKSIVVTNIQSAS